MSAIKPAWAESLWQLLFPVRHCPYCAGINGTGTLCAACAAESAALPRCMTCAQFAAVEAATELCPDCTLERPAFRQARAGFPYEGELRNQLRTFKYQEQTWRRRPLAELLYATLQEHYPGISFDAVVPVPLSAARLKERGYNQSQLLSSLLARKLGLNHCPEILWRTKETPPLYPYDGAERRRLLDGVFAAKAVAGLTILLVDDIFTSGATLDACSKALKIQQAQDVYALTVAATVMA